MSRERARRRAEREAAAETARRGAAERGRRERARRDRRRRVGAALGLRGLRPRRSRPPSALRRRRRRQDAVLVGLLVLVHAVIWLATGSWGWRLTAVALSVMAWPVLTTLLFDRRPTG